MYFRNASPEFHTTNLVCFAAIAVVVVKANTFGSEYKVSSKLRHSPCLMASNISLISWCLWNFKCIRLPKIPYLTDQNTTAMSVDTIVTEIIETVIPKLERDLATIPLSY